MRSQPSTTVSFFHKDGLKTKLASKYESRLWWKTRQGNGKSTEILVFQSSQICSVRGGVKKKINITQFSPFQDKYAFFNATDMEKGMDPWKMSRENFWSN